MYAHVLAASATCDLTAAKAWKMCDTSRGGIVSMSELRNCLAKAKMPACEQHGLYILARKMYGSGMKKHQFNKWFAAAKKFKCGAAKPKLTAAIAWKVCDASRGGRVDSNELRACLPKANLTSAKQTCLYNLAKKMYGNIFMTRA